MASALSVLTICAGCQQATRVSPQPISLPPAPACMAPVAVPPVKVGDDARLALARSRAALVGANGNLHCSRQWYDAVRAGYGAKVE